MSHTGKILLRLDPPQMADAAQTKAEHLGLSRNAYLNRLVAADLGWDPEQLPLPDETITAALGQA